MLWHMVLWWFLFISEFLFDISWSLITSRMELLEKKRQLFQYTTNKGLCILLLHVKPPMSVARKVNMCRKCLNSICAKTSVSLMCTVKQAVLSRGWSKGCIWISSWLSVLNKCSECEKHRCFLSFPIHSARYRLFIDDNYEISKWKMMCYAWDRIVLVTEIASKNIISSFEKYANF